MNTGPFAGLDSLLVLIVLAVIVAAHPDTPAQLRRVRIAWRLWRDPYLHYSARAAWILAEGR
jgi:hypothetical protein